MNNHSRKSPCLRSLTALLLSSLLACMPVFQQTALSNPNPAPQRPSQNEGLQADTTISSVVAIASRQGVLLQWRTSFELDNVGFNIYRERAGQRVRVNREIILGSAFIVGQNVPLRAGYSYSWFDASGTVDSLYSIESMGLDGTIKSFGKVTPQWQGKIKEGPLVDSNKVTSTASSPSQKEYPAQSGPPAAAEGLIEDQWAIASQAGLKISINKDGWYRVTQQQMAAVGYSPTVDIGNLRLFNGARELAIRTSRANGQFVSGDFIEFYGQGVDTPTTDTNIYYLVAGSSPGKRITVAGKKVPGVLRSEATQLAIPAPANTVVPPLELNSPRWFWWLPPLNDNSIRREATTTVAAPILNRKVENTPEFYDEVTSSTPLVSTPNESPRLKTTASEAVAETVVAAPPAPKPARKPAARKAKKKRNLKRKYSHAPVTAAAGGTATSFDYTVERKDRTVYFSSLINGETENFFGAVISSQPVDQTLATPNPYSGGGGAASLVIALQGATSSGHQVDVQINDVPVGTIGFSGVLNNVTTFSVPVSVLRNANPRSINDGVTNNTTTFTSATAAFSNADVGKEIVLSGGSTPTHLTTVIASVTNSTTVVLQNNPLTAASGINATIMTVNRVRLTPAPNSGLMIVDYLRLTYPHSFTADTGSLRLTLGPTDSATLDGFNSSSIRLIDYTDPFAVRVSQPRTQSSGPGFSFDVPAATGRDRLRTLLAIPESDANAPAGISFNQPSSLNLSTNGADLLIISHRSLISSLTPLVNLRTSQGMLVSVVDVEDIYDEFSYGAHGPKAIKDFLAWASSHWTRPPRYIILAGDASSDPRNYLGFGNFDFVPTKLVDATFSETASDDWLCDFNDDGAADIPIGRLPVRTVAEANLVISKVVNFAPSNTPQSALLVADAQGSYYFNFEQANSQVQALLPAGMTAQRVDRRLEPSDSQARQDILDKFNAGVALVNYSGHGNVDTWTGGAIFTSNLAMGLTNGNKLPFVVVMDCLNGYFQDPELQGIAEALMKAPNGGAVAAFASSGLTFPEGQHAMSTQLYTTLYGTQPIALGDAIKIAKAATFDIDVRRTWIFFGDPSMKIR